MTPIVNSCSRPHGCWDHLDELVFVGGCVTGLLITDDAAPGVRATIDVDVIAEIKSYGEYVRFAERLRGAGFAEDISEGAPLCRWRSGKVVLDVMPLDQRSWDSQTAGTERPCSQPRC